MFGKRGPHNAILIFAIQGSMLGSIVVGLPVILTEDVKDKIDEPEQIVYAAHCNGRGHVLFNETRCPVGSDNADDIISDCYCTPQCVPCKEEHEDQV
ncbi:hypothetical protein FOPG_13262 [Fusarium oxysporum f. sp. conglutinans race 2 54008]|uniref:Uncharacterized protein n=1 Tax=Fusarium oxysporum f. sp. conglutinans race 2 54008 TaxID=1089457 RepID=X0HGU4_FUSOX|nr:hypothetical protein FOPG_13262 [Fusarium oxysporum f. sp. conglutinans race 2 54008]